MLYETSDPVVGAVPGTRPVLSERIRKLTALLDRLADRTPSWLFAGALLVVLLLSVAISGGGYAAHESEKYVPYYLSNRPVLYKIFDIQNIEIEEGQPVLATGIKPSYRPRPLSYLADDLDVNFIGWCSRHGYPHLLSASYYVFWVLEGLVLWVFFRRHLKLHPAISGLLILLISTDVVLFFCGNYFRSAKPGATFFLLSAFVAFAECFRATRRGLSALRVTGLACLAALLLFCACLFDEIPVAYTAAAALMLAVEYLLHRKSELAKNYLVPLIAVGAVLIAFVWFDLVFYPKLVWFFTQEKVWMGFQTGTARAMLSYPRAVLAGSVSVFIDVFGYLLGSVSGVLGLIGMIVLAWMWDSSSESEGSGVRTSSWGRFPVVLQPAFVRIFAGAVLMVLCIYGMISRWPPIMDTDARRTPYFLPLTMVFLVFSAASLASGINKRLVSRGAAVAALVILVASNFSSMPSQRRILISHAQNEIQFTRVLLLTLHKPWLRLPDMPAGEDFERAQKQVYQSHIYEALHRVMTESR